MEVNTKGKIPIKIWSDEIDENALDQAISLSNMPFAFKHIALMPDCHLGYSMPIGGVLATKDVVLPSAVGLDIGCGMCAMKTNITKIDEPVLKEIVERIKEYIPVGFKHHSESQEWDGFNKAPETPIVQKHLESARKQLGTLGGGNHFIEIQKDQEGYIWVMVHSGSRNFGLQIAKHYIALSEKLCKQWYSNVPLEGPDKLAFLPLETNYAQEYITAMDYALDFAYANRQLILKNVRKAFEDILGGGIGFDPEINIHHNFAKMENHFGHNVVVHRKGATEAREGQRGIIPGSQGTASYIVTGKGNPESFMSCSHGAGRKMGRKQAQRELSVEEEAKVLDDQGIIHSIRTEKDLDEAPGAYKDINTVMEEQSDLVEILVELKPLAVIKG